MALDITTDAAEVAIVPTGQTPTEADWITGTWVRTAPSQALPSINRLTTENWYIKVTATVENATDFAWLQVLVGPAGPFTLPDAVTKVDVWSRVHDNPEVPVQKHGTVSIG